MKLLTNMNKQMIREEFDLWWDREQYSPEHQDISDWWLNYIDILLEEIEGEIEKVKEEVQKQTGAYKYDDCYDDCIKIINSYKTNKE